MITAERIKDGHIEKFSQEDWVKMVSRGDARKWKVKKRDVAPPPEIQKAFDNMRKKKAEEKEAQDLKGKDEENE